MINLTEDQIERYSRQIILSEIGGTGQKKIMQAKKTRPKHPRRRRTERMTLDI